MSASLVAADRVVLLLSLVPYLREHGPTSVTELSSAFEVDAELLRSLIAFLGTAGVPGETMTSQHEDMFDIDWAGFEEHDVVSLTNIVAVDDTPRFASTETSALIAGLQSLTAMLPEREAQVAKGAAEKLGAALGIDGSNSAVSVTSEPQDQRISILFAALRDQRRLTFEYRDARGIETQRIVDPLQLTQGDGVWYLRAYCLDRGAERLFRADRMVDIRVLAEAAEHQSSEERSDARDATPQGNVTVVARVRESALPRITGYRPKILSEAAPGWLRVSMELGSARAAAAAIQSAQGELIIEEPAVARAAARDWAERALAQYDV
ncbi:MAG: helix-turn-helix transcriptional regulator [Leucobacter sp.]